MYFDRNKERIAVIHLCFSIGERESVCVSEPEWPAFGQGDILRIEQWKVMLSTDSILYAELDT